MSVEVDDVWLYEIVLNYLKKIEENCPLLIRESPHFLNGDRKTIVQWIGKLTKLFKIGTEAQHLAVFLFDYFIADHIANPLGLYLIGAACFSVACKVNDIDTNVPNASKILKCAPFENVMQSYLLKSTEILILQHFNWNVIRPTEASFLDYYAASCLAIDLEYLDDDDYSTNLTKCFNRWISYFRELILYNDEFRDFRPSKIASSVVIATRLSIGLAPDWPDFMVHLTGWIKAELVQIVDKLQHYLKAESEVTTDLSVKLSYTTDPYCHGDNNSRDYIYQSGSGSAVKNMNVSNSYVPTHSDVSVVITPQNQLPSSYVYSQVIVNGDAVAAVPTTTTTVLDVCSGAASCSYLDDILGVTHPNHNYQQHNYYPPQQVSSITGCTPLDRNNTVQPHQTSIAQHNNQFIQVIYPASSNQVGSVPQSHHQQALPTTLDHHQQQHQIFYSPDNNLYSNHNNHSSISINPNNNNYQPLHHQQQNHPISSLTSSLSSAATTSSSSTLYFLLPTTAPAQQSSLSINSQSSTRDLSLLSSNASSARQTLTSTSASFCKYPSNNSQRQKRCTQSNCTHRCVINVSNSGSSYNHTKNNNNNNASTSCTLHFIDTPENNNSFFNKN